MPLDHGSGADDSPPPPASGRKSVTPTGYRVPVPGENDHPGDSDAYDMFGTQWYALEPAQKELLRGKWTAAARADCSNDIATGEVHEDIRDRESATAQRVAHFARVARNRNGFPTGSRML
eukprot:COSAG02_NODE_1034_length_15056_cov_2.888948_10_plen_120_part_00